MFKRRGEPKWRNGQRLLLLLLLLPVHAPIRLLLSGCGASLRIPASHARQVASERLPALRDSARERVRQVAAFGLEDQVLFPAVPPDRLREKLCIDGAVMASC